jgi:hypothetical protein
MVGWTRVSRAALIALVFAACRGSSPDVDTDESSGGAPSTATGGAGRGAASGGKAPSDHGGRASSSAGTSAGTSAGISAGASSSGAGPVQPSAGTGGIASGAASGTAGASMQPSAGTGGDASSSGDGGTAGQGGSQQLGGAAGEETGGEGGAAGASLWPGCRAPNEPGCESCCRQNTNDCDRFWVSNGQLDHGYDAVMTYGKVCPESCPVCSTCWIPTEQALRELECRPECDCTEPRGADPCFSPTSCECYCVEMPSLIKMCPGIKECP